MVDDPQYLEDESNMNNREWFCLALRVLGVWQVLFASDMFLQHTFVLLIAEQHARSWYAATWALSGVIRMSLAIAVLMFAPAIAKRFYPKLNTASHNQSGNRVLNAALLLLGVYCILQAAPHLLEFLSHATIKAFDPSKYASMRLDYRLLLGASAWTALAAVLIMWPDSIIESLERLRRHEEHPTHSGQVDHAAE